MDTKFAVVSYNVMYSLCVCVLCFLELYIIRVIVEMFHGRLKNDVAAILVGINQCKSMCKPGESFIVDKVYAANNFSPCYANVGDQNTTKFYLQSKHLYM